MHVQTISAFESENGSPTKTTLSKISTVLERSGVEFAPNNGTSLSEYKYYPTDSYVDVLQDCLHTLNKGDEILFHCADDRLSIEAVSLVLDQIGKKDIRMRATTCAANNALRKDREYRLLPQDYFSTSQLIVIYADKISLHVDEKNGSYRSLTIKNNVMASAMRKQFEYWWKNGKPVQK